IFRKKNSSASALSFLSHHLPTGFMCFGEDELPSLHGRISQTKLSSYIKKLRKNLRNIHSQLTFLLNQEKFLKNLQM
uniref:Uncharacterized protein n=1 Tax=Corvus moneduloides TaxID=1196302 RepID=A0A8C3EWC3_CORMO